MTLVYGSSSSSYMDCMVVFGVECFISTVWGSYNPVLLHWRLRRWTSSSLEATSAVQPPSG